MQLLHLDVGSPIVNGRWINHSWTDKIQVYMGKQLKRFNIQLRHSISRIKNKIDCRVELVDVEMMEVEIELLFFHSVF